MIYHDMETGPLPESYLLETFRPTFEPNKTLKDPAKIEADLAAKRKSWLDDSALHAERGQVLCIGWAVEWSSLVHIIDEGNEVDTLVKWLDVVAQYQSKTFGCHNSLGFDWGFVRRRCILNKIPFPFYNGDRWKPWTVPIFDSLVDWQCGDRREWISLDALAKALGVGSKVRETSARFHEVYNADRTAAIAHLTNDVVLTKAVCERLRA